MPFYLENIDLFGKKVTCADPFGHIKSGSAEKGAKKGCCISRRFGLQRFSYFHVSKKRRFCIGESDDSAGAFCKFRRFSVDRPKPGIYNRNINIINSNKYEKRSKNITPYLNFLHNSNNHRLITCLIN